MAEKKIKVFVLNSRFNIQKNKFEIKIELSERLRTIIYNSLSITNDITTSENWKDETGKKLEYYKGQLLYDGLTSDLNIRDDFGSSKLKRNIALLRSKKLLETGQVILAIDFTYSEDIKYMCNGLKEVLSLIMKSLDYEYTATGYIEEKEKLKEIVNETVN